jgi:hypothetical protein
MLHVAPLPGNMLTPKAHARGPFAEKPAQEREKSTISSDSLL